MMRKLINFKLWFLGIYSFYAIVSFAKVASAQVIPDNTLPNNSEVKVEGDKSIIEGGTTAGGNLFHSFEKFSVLTGGEAHFNNAVDIQNIITRVTGSSVSDIDGLIKANSTANLFLINPSGIVFGENVRLDIGGSFVGSTADSLQFSDGTKFSTVNANNKSLLSINVPLGLQYGNNQTGNIVNSGNLSVNAGKNITLIGNTVESTGSLNINEGQISLAAISENGLASLREAGKLLDIEYSFKNTINSQPNTGNIIVKGRIGVEKHEANNTGKIVLQAQDSIDIIQASIQSKNGSDIDIQAKKVSVIDSIIESYLSSKVNNNGGNISIQADSIDILDSRSLRGTTRISSQVKNGAQGNGGDIDIKTGSLLITKKARISAVTNSRGNAGNVSINANDAIKLLEGDIFSQVDKNGIGNSGNINIQARSLELNGGDGNRALLNTSIKAKGSGIAGTIFVNVKDKIKLKNGGRIVSNLERGATGSGGNIFISSQLLFLETGGRLQALTEGMGRAGNIDVRADESVSILGNSEYTSSAGIYTSSEQQAGGEGGNINVITSKLNISDNAVLNARSRSSFKGGNIKAKVNEMELTDGGQILTTGFADGNAGDIEINAKEGITISGSDSSYFRRQVKLFNQKRNADSLVANDTPSSGLLARNRGTNNGGKIVINTEKLTVQDGGILSSESTGKGSSGNIKINALEVELIDGGQVISNSKDSGNAGNIILNEDMTNANRIIIYGSDSNYLDRFTQASKLVEQGIFSEINEIIPNDGSNSALLAKTQGSGSAGSIKLNAKELIISNQAEISASTSEVSTGSGGSITLNVQDLKVRDRAQIAVSSNGIGNAGNILVNARSIDLNNNAFLTANTQSPKIDPKREQATININSPNLTMRRGSNIFTNAEGENVAGGNINIETDFLIANENSDISANSVNFQGGNVLIDALGIFGTDFRDEPTSQSDITATGASSDLSGTVELNTPEVDPNSGLIELPSIPVDTEVAQGCYSPGYAQSSFVIGGGGGLPSNPKDILIPNTAQIDWVSVKPSNNRSLPPVTTKPTSAPKRIVEATGATLNAKGQIVLAANPSTLTSNNISKNNSISCQSN